MSARMEAMGGLLQYSDGRVMLTLCAHDDGSADAWLVLGDEPDRVAAVDAAKEKCIRLLDASIRNIQIRLDAYTVRDQIQELREAAKAHREAAKEPGHERYTAQHIRSAEIFESVQGLLAFYAEREAQAKRSVLK